MDLKRLRYFVCVSELGSFTLAARHLGVAQPALSRHIRQLESECGSTLLRRNGRGAELSEVGKIVLEHGRSLLEQVDRLESGLKAAKGAPVGAVNVGMPPSVCMILVEPLFHRVRRDYPGVRLHISEAFSGDVREWLVGRPARYRRALQSGPRGQCGRPAFAGRGFVSLLRANVAGSRAARDYARRSDQAAAHPARAPAWPAHPRRQRLRRSRIGARRRPRTRTRWRPSRISSAAPTRPRSCRSAASIERWRAGR